jgi:hypothetical protein
MTWLGSFENIDALSYHVAVGRSGIKLPVLYNPLLSSPFIVLAFGQGHMYSFDRATWIVVFNLKNHNVDRTLLKDCRYKEETRDGCDEGIRAGVSTDTRRTTTHTMQISSCRRMDTVQVD